MDNGVPASGVIYEPPRIDVLGTVADLTQLQDKKYGATDGYVFQGVPISNASP